MKIPENIAELNKLPVHLMGLIFYKKSPRYAGNLNPESLLQLQVQPEITGVFVNEAPEIIIQAIKKYHLKYVQLHGMESPVTCKEMRNKGVKVIKAFSIEEKEDFKKCIFYENVCDFFLFDTKTSQHGGSGKKFDWNTLNAYEGNTPFFLSGGIGPEDAYSIKQLNHPQFYGIDLNSRFETEPGIKDIAKLKTFIKELSI